MNDCERQVMELLLRGQYPALAVLRAQLAVASVSVREFTGVGFFTTFTVPATAPRLELRHNAHLGDVSADVPGMRYGAGFVLWLTDGVLSILEGFAYAEEPFPRELTGLRPYYLRPRHPGAVSLTETAERDLGYALRELA